MGTIFSLGLVALLAVVALLIGIFAKKKDGFDEIPVKGAALGVGAVLTVVFLCIWGFSSATVIDPRHVGVVNAFGKTTDALDNGFHWVAPWATVTEFDGTIQSMTLAGDQGDDNHVVVRLKDGSTAHVNTNLQWRINSEDKAGVKQLFGDYRDPVKVDELFVERQTRAAVYTAFATFDPTAGIVDSTTPTPIAAYAANALDGLRTAIGNKGITLVSLTISDIAYDGTTNAKIARLRALAADKRAAELQVDINTNLAKANDKLSVGAKDEGTLYQLCLATTEKLLETGKQLPPAWSCGSPTVQPVLPVR